MNRLRPSEWKGVAPLISAKLAAKISAEGTAAVDLIFGFTGKALDEDTGLGNHVNRWYDPLIGQWISEDPIVFDGGDSNVRRYVSNVPTIHIDVDGRQIADPQGDAPPPIILRGNDQPSYFERDGIVYRQNPDGSIDILYPVTDPRTWRPPPPPPPPSSELPPPPSEQLPPEDSFGPPKQLPPENFFAPLPPMRFPPPPIFEIPNFFEGDPFAPNPLGNPLQGVGDKGLGKPKFGIGKITMPFGQGTLQGGFPVPKPGDLLDEDPMDWLHGGTWSFGWSSGPKLPPLEPGHPGYTPPGGREVKPGEIPKYLWDFWTQPPPKR